MTSVLLCERWIGQLKQYETIYLGFSGGLDSTVLLHCLAQSELKEKVHAIHVHHGLHSQADVWQVHCEKICRQLNIPLQIKKVVIAQKTNLEAQARQARYDAFSSYIQPNDALVLAHHADDQAETVLLQLFRGCGVDGVAAMSETRQLSTGDLLRPFLALKRSELQDYAKHFALDWMHDDSNEDTKYSRNFVRHAILPLIQTRWPHIVDNLCRSAKHFKQAQKNLQSLARLDSGWCEASNWVSKAKEQEAPFQFHIDASYLSLPTGRQCNVLRNWFKENQIAMPSHAIFNRIIHDLIRSVQDAQPIIEWGDVVLRRFRQTLYLEKRFVEKASTATVVWSTFPESLELERGTLIAEPVVEGLQLPEAASEIVIDFRKGGEQFFWHGQTKSLKKLMQAWGVPPWQRDKIPLVIINHEIAAVVGYAISDKFWGKTRAFQIHLSRQFDSAQRVSKEV